AIDPANTAVAPSPSTSEVTTGTRCDRLIAMAMMPSTGQIGMSPTVDACERGLDEPDIDLEQFLELRHRALVHDDDDGQGIGRYDRVVVGQQDLVVVAGAGVFLTRGLRPLAAAHDRRNAGVPGEIDFLDAPADDPGRPRVAVGDQLERFRRAAPQRVDDGAV